MKVVKFGGSSLATGAQMEKVFNIIVSDPKRKIIVVSAPGKRYEEDGKVTDLLITCAYQVLQDRDVTDLIDVILERYAMIVKELELSLTIIEEIRNNIVNVLNGDKSKPDWFLDAVKASGEDNTARLVTAFFQHRGVEASYINPKEAGLLVSDEPGNAQVLPESFDRLIKLRERSGILIVPGFFGYNLNGEVVTFSRSGSDITGSILANGVRAELYENFTDVDAVYSVNPKFIHNPTEIRELTYREMRELSYAGFSVFHDEALIPAFQAKIPVQVKNTNNPSSPGTLMVSKRNYQSGPVTGIASAKGFCSIYVSKYLMNREMGFGRRLLQIIEDFGVSYEHIPSGIDDVTIILKQDQMDESTEEKIINRIQLELKADEVKVEHNLALIMVVGEGMRHNVGTTARASQALANQGVNIEMINQGSSEVSMMFGVKEVDEVRSVQALYEEFFVGVLV